MSPVNFSIGRKAIKETGYHVGSGIAGCCYLFGPYAIKMGCVDRQEYDNLQEAHKRMGDRFPEAHVYRKSPRRLGWMERADVLIMNRVAGVRAREHGGEFSYAKAAKECMRYGIYHPDIHSSNVLVDADGNYNYVDADALKFDSQYHKEMVENYYGPLEVQ